MTARMRTWCVLGGVIIFVAAGVRLWTTHLNRIWVNTQTEANKVLSNRELADFAARRFGTNAQSVTAVAPVDLKQPVRLAIGPLGTADGGGQLSDLVLAQLSGAPGLTLVERQQLQTVLAEIKLSLSGFVRARDAVRAGKLLKADWFLLGTEATVNDRKSLVLRLVDARTGILRDAAVFSSATAQAQLAEEIAAFVRQSRKAAASGQAPVFLALGVFEDVGLNNRLAEFPNQLSGYLTAAYHGGKITMLEREDVDALLQEIELDVAGLTDNPNGNPPAPMQSAFWLVSGRYQSYEVNGLEVELRLDVRRIFGSRQTVTLRDAPGEPISRKAKQAIDDIMAQNPAWIVPSTITEARAEMSHGVELMGHYTMPGIPLVYAHQYMGMFSANDFEKKRRNIEEAIHAFKTVLLLEPTNRMARMYLAAALRHGAVNRPEQARGYYREILEESVNDQWTEWAKKALVESFHDDPDTMFSGTEATKNLPREMAHWFSSAAMETTNVSAREFYQSEARKAGSDAAMTAEDRLFQDLQSCEDILHGRSRQPGMYPEEMGMYKFVTEFNGGPAAAAGRLVELLPKMKSKYPDLEPYLLALVARFQVDTNALVISEFRQELKGFQDSPLKMIAPNRYWTEFFSICDWAFDHKLYDLVALAIEGRQRAAAKDASVGYVYGYRDEDNLALAYAYRGMERWQDARNIFQTFSNRTVPVWHQGPWGRGNNIVIPFKEAAYCAQKLGLAVSATPRQFEMGKSCYSNCVCAFAVDADGLWICSQGQLLKLDFELRIKEQVPVPGDITSICVTPAAVWAGTDGAGLIEYDRTSHQTKQFGMNNGLLMSDIATLDRVGDNIWIGYGRRNYYFRPFPAGGEGGLGKLDLTTGKFSSYTPPFNDAQDRGIRMDEPPELPTRASVIGVTHGAESDVWFLAQTPDVVLRHYQPREKVWEAYPHASSLASDEQHLFAGQFWNYDGQGTSDALGVRVLDFKDKKWRDLKGDPDLPPGTVSALAVDGDHLWVGGMGYIAMMDLKQEKIQKIARVPVAVYQIAIGGGYLWARYDCQLHRVSLESIQ